ncbi:MAG: FG-GAP-like repeat-containing protein [Rhodanobacter sp.]
MKIRIASLAAVGAGSRWRLVVAFVLLAGCQGLQREPAQKAVAYRPDFNRAVFLENVAETTATASIGNLDGDGDPDIVLAKGRHWPLHDLVLLNDGHGHFDDRHALDATADRSYTAALADLDGDGDLDLAVGNDRPDTKRIYFNDGHGHFTQASTFGEANWSTRNITLADLNGDHRADIIVANRGGPHNLSKNQVCLNDGGGRFPSCVVLSGESATTIAAADFDGNRTIDLVVPHPDGGQTHIFPNDGTGHFKTKQPIGPARSATRAVAVGDLDGNGLPGLIMGDDQGDALVYLNQGQGRFSAPIAAGDENDDVYSIATADLNGDGSIDMVLGDQATPGVVLINRGDGRSFQNIRFGDGAGAMYGLAIGDMTGDDCPDIVAARSGAPSALYVTSCHPKEN